MERRTKETTYLKVSTKTNVGKLAASVKNARQSDPEKEVVLRFIGAGSGAQALKAVIIANRMLQHELNEECTIRPMFGTNEGNSTIIFMHLEFKPATTKTNM